MNIHPSSQAEKVAQHVEERPTSLEDGKLHDNNENNDISGEVSNVVRDDVASDTVTFKTWGVIALLCLVYGLAWWPIPVTIIMQSYVANKLGNAESAYWFVSIYTATAAVGFLVAGANSDLFGRRLTLMVGEAHLAVGLILIACAKTPTQFEAGMGIGGFGAGLCFMILCSIPELLPLKYRHIGLGIAEAMGFITVVFGPITARLATVTGGSAWRWLYYADLILLAVAAVPIAWLYHPPKHPRGVPWHEGIAGLDWIGLFLGSAGLALVLTGIIYTSYTPASDLHVILPLSLGFPTLIVFGVWETFSSVKYKVCPPTLFKANRGRNFSAPIVIGAIIYMYYFGINIIYPTMVVELWTTAETSLSEQLALTTPSNLGLCAGVTILGIFGTRFSKLIGFRWALIIALGLMLICGGILALVTPSNKTLMIAFTVLQQLFYAYSVVASISLVLWGVEKQDLGLATGLAGASRNFAGSMSEAIWTTVLANTQSRRAAQTLPQAAIKAGLSADNAQKLLQVWALGPTARAAVPDVNADILAAADLAWRWSYAHGLRVIGLGSLAFGLLAWLLLFVCVDPEPRMTDQIEVFLENDVQAEKNEFH